MDKPKKLPEPNPQRDDEYDCGYIRGRNKMWDEGEEYHNDYLDNKIFCTVDQIEKAGYVKHKLEVE